jgi:anti-anti-sigma factor
VSTGDPSTAAGSRTQVVVARGAVGLQEARRLEADVVDGLRHGRVAVVLDLSDVTEVGPGLLGVLLRIRRGVTRIDGQLVLVVSGPPVAELVATSLLGRLIDVTADRQTALRLIADRASP